MKRIKTWLSIGILIITITGFAQENPIDIANNVQLSYSKTTSIAFPYAVKSVDRGSQDILAQKARGVENILLLKAGKQNFTQTNLTVVTADSKLYVFVLSYDEACPDLNIKAENLVASGTGILSSLQNANQKEIEQIASLALIKKIKNSGLKKSRFQITLEVSGIFIHEDVLYLRVVFENNSKINYDIDQLRFFIRDKRKSKRTASQEIEILPLYTTSSFAVIPHQSEVVKVYALEKFTIPENKYLTIQLIEKRGGRHLELDINNNLTDKVFPIAEFNTDNF